MQTCARFVVVLGLAFLAACRGNTTCTPGTHLCTDNDGKDYTGDPFKGGGTQLRVCATTGEGADADGEFLVEKDCGKSGLVCFEDVAKDDDTHKFDGCIDPACGEAGGGPCTTEGATACELATLESCGKNGDGCLVWQIEQDCSTGGQSCAYSGDVAGCS